MGNTVVKAAGFELVLGDKVTIGQLFQEIERVEKKELTLNGKKTVTLVDTKSNYIVGLVLSYRNDKKSLATATDENGDLVVQKGELSDDERKTEAVIFVLNPTSLKGAMFQYFGSVSTSGMARLFKSRFLAVKRQLIREKSKELSQGGRLSKEKARDRAAAFYKGDLIFKVLIRNTNFSSLLVEWSTNL